MTLLFAVPEEVAAPSAVSFTPASVELSWEVPGLPNGIITLYTIERRVVGSEEITVVVSKAADEPRKHDVVMLYVLSAYNHCSAIYNINRIKFYNY